MKLIIDIPYGHYLTIKDGFLNECIKSTTEAIVNGTPLEKHDEEIIKETVASVWDRPPYTEVLDKIRAEILEKCFDVPYKNQAFDYGLKIVKWSDVLDIIDKYRKEIKNEHI